MNPWDLAHLIVDGEAPGRYASLWPELSRLAAIAEIEPSVAYYTGDTRHRTTVTVKRSSQSTCSARSTEGFAMVGHRPSAHWPAKRALGWYHDAMGVAIARATAAKHFPYPDCKTDVVTIAHLDTGNDAASDSATPPCFDVAALRTFLPNEGAGGHDRFTGLSGGHGPGTLSILAGGRVRLRHAGYPDYADYLGGAPLARVFSFRITDSVAVIWPKRMAEAITTAPQNGADINSMSIGGAPSGALRDAINDAYDNGTVVVVATGDFLRLPLLGIQTPHTLVYPARFTRTMPVAGITALEKSYGQDPGWLSLLRARDWFSWMLRGSYDPEDRMDNAVAAYTPNIARHRATPGEAQNTIDLNFGGTSAATPQVAAAAALWLQTRWGELQPVWRTWRKTETTYRAITASARTKIPGYSRELFGAGVLDATATLERPVPTRLQPQPPARIEFDWVTVAAAAIEVVVGKPKSREARLHEQMTRTEVAQLVATSRSLQQVLTTAAATDGLPVGAKRRVTQLLLADSRASMYLKNALRRRKVTVR